MARRRSFGKPIPPVPVSGILDRSPAVKAPREQVKRTRNQGLRPSVYRAFLSFSDATWVALSHPAMSTIMVGVVAPLDALDAQHIELALDSRRRCGTSAPSSHHTRQQSGRALRQPRLTRTCPSKVAIVPQTPPARSAPPMDLSVEATDQRDRSLPVVGFKGTSEEIERQWYEQVYRGQGDSMAQLTWRAVLIGSCLGGVLSLTNLYIGLKAGWGFGVAITASILSYAIWTSLLKVGLARTPMTILENNCMQSTASSAGYSTGGTLVSAFA
ncbi:MAG: hypothetical protein E6G80_11740, partial [Alphaproteobacteria bacterium]